MEQAILNYQNIEVVEDLEEVDGMRFSSISGGACGNWSALSIAGC